MASCKTVFKIASEIWDDISGALTKNVRGSGIHSLRAPFFTNVFDKPSVRLEVSLKRGFISNLSRKSPRIFYRGHLV